MIEKPADKSRRIERNELVHGARRQALLGECRRGDGAGGDEHGEILRADALDERNDGEHFADAGAVQPNQRASRPRQACFTVALSEASGMFLAAFQAPRQQPRCQRRCRRDRTQVDTIAARAADRSRTLSLPVAADRLAAWPRRVQPITSWSPDVVPQHASSQRGGASLPGSSSRCRWTMKYPHLRVVDRALRFRFQAA